MDNGGERPTWSCRCRRRRYFWSDRRNAEFGAPGPQTILSQLLVALGLLRGNVVSAPPAGTVLAG